jgi:hypothetical protein
MTKELPSNHFNKDKEDTVVNLETIRMTLNECIDEGILDAESDVYNELIELIDQARIVKTYPDLADVITKAKKIETGVDGWLSRKLRETISISWVKISNK